MLIRPGKTEEQNLIFEILSHCARDMRSKGILQWHNDYPRPEMVEADLNSGALYVAEIDHEIVGVMTFDQNQSPEYTSVEWKYKNESVFVIHRLAVSPNHQGKGIARKLMDFALENIQNLGGKIIRLDAYSGNDRTINFYKNRNYEYAGDIYFPGRDLPFYCFEKQV